MGAGAIGPIDLMRTIGLSISANKSGIRRTLDALAEVFQIRCEEREIGDEAGIDAWVLDGVDGEALRRIGRCEKACYVVLREDQLAPCGVSSALDFGVHPALPSVLSGRRVVAGEISGVRSLPKELPNATVLASKEGAPVWAIREVNGHPHHFVSLPVPELGDGSYLFQHFQEKDFIRLVPLLHFLRTLADGPGWEPPRLQACFMMDDPNLHWRTYGFIDFAEIAEHARTNQYHMSFAMIPLDTWYVHGPTAQLFLRHRDHISLLIHGNNHVGHELSRAYVGDGLTRILQQALSRVEVFERRSGLEVSKVMAPPHGACSENALRQMARLGFEAACISRGSLRRYNVQATWLRTLGMRPSDMIAGLPVFPRFPFTGSCHNRILISALLHQPIIARGHHQDVADGLHCLADLSSFVNSLGEVHWADMKRIARSHYARRFDGRNLHIRMLTRRIEVHVPEGIDRISVERPWSDANESGTIAWRSVTAGSEWKVQHLSEPMSVLAGQSVEIQAESAFASNNIGARNGRGIDVWPVVRRQLTEARDRLAPVMRRVSAFVGKPNET